MSGAAFWEDFYGGGKSRWSGNVNQLLMAEVGALNPGHALDVGCGQGADAIWLAQHGWRVTAVDVAPSALAFGAAQAAVAGLGDEITWERHDLDESFPIGQFDLVTSCYLHSPVDLGRTKVLRASAAAVRPGGTLIILSHAGPPSWDPHDHPHAVALPTAAEVLTSLALDDGWDIERCALVERAVTAPDGSPGTRPDSVVRTRRRIDHPAGGEGIGAHPEAAATSRAVARAAMPTLATTQRDE